MTKCYCPGCRSEGLLPQRRDCIYWRECDDERGQHGELCVCPEDRGGDGMYPIQCDVCLEMGRVTGLCEAQEFMGGHGVGMCTR